MAVDGASRTDQRASSGTRSIRTRCPWRRRRRRRGSRARVILRRRADPRGSRRGVATRARMARAAAAARRPSAPPRGISSSRQPFDTPRSLVVPAGGAVLKLNAPSHFEADHEADALACWDGRGAVRLLARDDERRALLLERCVPGRPARRGERRRGLDHGRAPRATARRRADRSSLPAARRRGRPLDGGGAATLGATAGGRSSARSSTPRSTCSAASTAVRPGSSTRTSTHGTSSAPSASRGS